MRASFDDKLRQVLAIVDDLAWAAETDQEHSEYMGAMTQARADGRRKRTLLKAKQLLQECWR